MQNRYLRTGLVLVVLVGCLAAIATAAPKLSGAGRIELTASAEGLGRQKITLITQKASLPVATRTSTASGS